MIRLDYWVETEARRRGLTRNQIFYKLRFTMEYDGLIIKKKGKAKYVAGMEYKAK